MAVRFRVRVRDSEAGELRTVEVEADSKEEARRLARLRVEPEGEEEEEESRGKVCSRCGAPVGLLSGLVSSLCKPYREADRQQWQAEQAHAARQRGVAEAEAHRQAVAQRQAAEYQQRLARTVGPRRWRYKMVQIPPNIAVDEGGAIRGVAAAYLERVVEEYAAFGWEFHRVDELGVTVNPGCLAALFGGKGESSRYFVVTFRCPV